MSNLVTISQIAKSVAIQPDILRQYLDTSIDTMQKSVFVESKIPQIELKLTEDGKGVFFCLLKKAVRPSSRPHTTNDYVNQLLKGVYQGACERGYGLSYMFNHHDLATETYFRNLLARHPNAGVLVLIPQRADTIARVCAEMNHPCLVIDYPSSPRTPTYTLNVNNYQAMKTMTNSLIELGHRRIAFITGLFEFESASNRFEGYKAALANAGIPFDPTLVKYGNWQMETAVTLTTELLSHPEPPSAIVCSNDLSALGAYRAIHAAGLHIPDDVSVTGFDDIPIVANIEPPLTTVRQSSPEMGYQAANIVINALEGDMTQALEHEHQLEFKMRQSISRR